MAKENKNKKQDKKQNQEKQDKNKEVEEGDTVKVEYEVKQQDGEVVDSSEKGRGQPIEFQVGGQQVIKGLDKEIRGMKVGDEKQFTVEPEEGYGERNEDKKKEFPKDKFPSDKEPQEGMMVALGTPDGKQVPAKILEVKDDTVVLDLNHPLAGKTLDFDIKLVDIS